MEFVRHHDATVYLTRSRELAFLANTLLRIVSPVAGVHPAGKIVRCGRCICNLGFSECWPALAVRRAPLNHDSRDGVRSRRCFELLYASDVSLFVADRARRRRLADLQGADADTRHGLRALPAARSWEAARGRHTVARARRRRRARNARHDRRGRACSDCWTNVPSCQRR